MNLIKLVWDLIWCRFILKFKQFFKFCVVGTMGAIIDIGGLWFLVEFAHAYYLLGAAISFTVATTNNYFLNKFWTFGDKTKPTAKQFLVFLAVSVGGLLINLGVMYLLVEKAGLLYLLAKAIASIVVLFWNFLMNKYVTFKRIYPPTLSKVI